MNKVHNAEIEQRAFDYFQSGFNCAEAVSKVIAEWYTKEPSASIPKVASGFGGGIGGSKGDTCGALTGGVIALGYLWGRMEPNGDKKIVYELASEFRKKFIDSFGSSNCQSLLNGFGEQENMIKCKKLTARAAGILSEMLEDLGLRTDGSP